uniref:DNA-directed RNA polymerase subunit delta n=1 Tax=Niallia sp. XMNu-256 TaxID=3082444 RepID=UPI00403FB116
MSVQYSKEELSEMSLIEIAYEVLAEKKQATPFVEIVEELKKLRGTTDEEIRSKIAQFYTELNIDGRFLSLGENQWGLRVWYPVDQVTEEIVNPVKAKKKKKAKKVVDDDLGFDDDLEEEVEGFDDPEDLLDDDLDDEDLEDLDDDLEEEEIDEDLEEIDDELDDDLDEDLEIDEDLEEDEFEIDEEEEDLEPEEEK